MNAIGDKDRDTMDFEKGQLHQQKVIATIVERRSKTRKLTLQTRMERTGNTDSCETGWLASWLTDLAMAVVAG